MTVAADAHAYNDGPGLLLQGQHCQDGGQIPRGCATAVCRPQDFRVGGVISVHNRDFLLYDCDAFTRQWYQVRAALVRSRTFAACAGASWWSAGCGGRHAGRDTSPDTTMTLQGKAQDGAAPLPCTLTRWLACCRLSLASLQRPLRAWRWRSPSHPCQQQHCRPTTATGPWMTASRTASHWCPNHPRR